MQFGWNQLWGALAMLVGVYWILKRKVPVGIEGRPPSFHVAGKWAVLLGIVAIVIGLVVALEIPRHVEIDRCLDGGGRFNYEKSLCERSETKSHLLRE